jgi:hypothetical protein
LEPSWLPATLLHVPCLLHSKTRRQSQFRGDKHQTSSSSVFPGAMYKESESRWANVRQYREWGYGTIRCLVSRRSFSAFASSYSPFSRCRWSGLSLESVGGSFSLTSDKVAL